MPAEVKLTATEGSLAGEEFTFGERATHIAGRAPDCQMQIVEEGRRIVSRHHCLFDVNPPNVRVRDCGSRNGTYVNGEVIGQRDEGVTAEEAAELDFPHRDLADGDEVRLGHTVLRVSVYAPAVCDECSREIPEEDRSALERAPGVYQCATCRARAEHATSLEPPKRKKQSVCAVCGRDVAGEVDQHRHGEVLCARCQQDPARVLKRLLELAKSGVEELVAIRGYEVVRELGHGGMGAVYLARDATSGEEVALKVMLPQVAVDKRARDYFLRETENTKALRHPHVVRFLQGGSSEGTFYFTAEFCAGGSVDHLMEKRGGTLDVDEACEIVLQALDGLSYTHQAEIPYVQLKDGSVRPGRGLVHRDLKPPNLLLSGSDGGRVAKIADFGLSKAFDHAGLSGYTGADGAGGTPTFMPRQQLIDFRNSKPEVDVWAMAACLYNMLTGAVPRDFKARGDLLMQVLSADPVPIRKRNRKLPEDLAKVIDEALVEEPEIRFKSAAELKQAIEGAC